MTSPDLSTTKAVKDITWHITFMSKAHTTSRNQSTKQYSASNPFTDRTPIARGRCERSPAHVEKYKLARMSIPFPLDSPDTPNSKGSIQWSQSTLQRRDTASTLKQ